MAHLATFQERMGATVVPQTIALPEKVLQAGEILYREYEEASQLYLVVSGLLKGSFISPKLHERIHGLYSTGDILGTQALEHLHHDEDVTACSGCRLIPFLAEQITSEPEWERYLLLNLDKQLRGQNKLRAFEGYDVEKRVAMTLLNLVERFGVERGAYTELSIPLSHEDLGGLCGVTRVTVTRALSLLKSKGCLQGGRGRYTVDIKRLREC